MNKKEYLIKALTKKIIEKINILENKYLFKIIFENKEAIIFYDNSNNRIKIFKRNDKIDLTINMKTNNELLNTITTLSYCYNVLIEVK